MSLKRSNDKGSGRRAASDGDDKLDRQNFWDEMQRRAASGEPFGPKDVAQAIFASEAVVAKHLLSLTYEGLLEKVDGGLYRAEAVKSMSQADFIKAMNVRIDPKRQQDQVEIERLKKNNDEMRRRLLEAIAERDRLCALLKKHGVDPSELP